MRVIIDVEHKAELESVIANEQGKARTRIIDVKDVIECAGRALENLGSWLPRTAATGLKVEVDLYTSSLPNSYKYKAYKTVFRLLYSRNKCYLVGVERVEANYCPAKRRTFTYTLTDDQKKRLIDFASYHGIN